jgi:hypothetical protein
MWILFVISFVPEFNEYKVIRFNTYTTSQQCEINSAVLKTTFTEGERAICVNE